jgi:hypothetical protein
LLTAISEVMIAQKLIISGNEKLLRIGKQGTKNAKELTTYCIPDLAAF